MKLNYKLVGFLFSLALCGIPHLALCGTPLDSTQVNEALKRQLNSEGKWITVEMADGTSFSTAPVGGGDVVGPASSTDGEMPRYSGTDGKTLKRSNTFTGLLKAASGVLGTATAGVDYARVTGETLTNVTLDGVTLQNFGGWAYGAPTTHTQVGTSTITVSGGGGYVITGTPTTIDQPTAESHALQKQQLTNHIASFTDHDLLARRLKRPMEFTDLMGGSSTQMGSPFLFGALLSGTFGGLGTTLAGTSTPGVITITSSATPNSGGNMLTSIVSLLIGGSEIFETGFNIETGGTKTLQIGFFDNTTTTTNPADACYIRINSSLVPSGSSWSANVNTGTATAGSALNINTWYKARVTIGAEVPPTSATFTITPYGTTTAVYSESISGVTLPTAANRQLGSGLIAIDSAGAAVAILSIDYLALIYGRELSSR